MLERDTLIKFGAAARVSQFQGLQGRQVELGGRQDETAMVRPVGFDAVLLYAPHAAQFHEGSGPRYLAPRLRF
jgi:hypothetical protein